VGGDGGVGKSTYLQRYCSDVFLGDTKLTVGVDFLTKIVTYKEMSFTFALWDLGGQDQFRFILKSYIRGAHVGLVFFALDRVQSFINLREWIPLLRDENVDLPLILIGTKADLEDEGNRVPDNDIQDLMAEHDIIDYIRTSSKTGENITLPMDRIAVYFYENNLVGI
jgi:small GTP-binding protein